MEINLSDIWKKQGLSEDLQTIIYNLMIHVEQFIKENAPRALYGEWAKKEDCWIQVKNNLVSKTII